MKLKIPTKSTYFSSNSLSTVQMLRKIIKFSNFMAFFVGCDVLTPNFTVMTSRFLLSVVSLIILFFAMFYNILEFGNDLIRFSFCIVALCSAIQGAFKLYTFISHRDNILNIVDRLEKFLTNFNTQRMNEIFEKWLMITSHVGLFITVLFVVCTFMFWVYPIIVYLFAGEKVLHLEIALPWIDWKTTSGYALNFVYCGSVLFLYVSSQVSTLFWIVTFIVVTFGQFELLKVFLEDLNELAVTNEKGKNDKKIKQLIKTTAQMHDELLE